MELALADMRHPADLVFSAGSFRTVELGVGFVWSPSYGRGSN